MSHLRKENRAGRDLGLQIVKLKKKKKKKNLPNLKVENYVLFGRLKPNRQHFR